MFLCSFVYGQQTQIVDFKTANVNITISSLKSKTIKGSVNYHFNVLKNTDSIYLDAKKNKNVTCFLNGKICKSVTTQNHIIIKEKFKKGTKNDLVINWEVKPQKALYFIDTDIDYLDDKTHKDLLNKQVWTQGQGKYTSHWLPSFDDMNEKVLFNMSISCPKGYRAIANGKLIKKTETHALLNHWQYQMQKPMSSYLVAFVIGTYNKQTKQSKSGVPLEFYYYPKDSLKTNATYRYSKQIFDFFETEIGFNYPWQNYKQVPVKDFLYAGMENTSLTIFSDAYMVNENAFEDRNYINVNAHELAHQWFGDLVTETSGTHHWLQEGFATYYALLAERNIYGDTHYYWQLYQYAQELLEQDIAGGSTSLLNPKSSSTTFYKKGAWVLHMLREKIGDQAFKKAVKNYLVNNKYKNVETHHFIKEAEQSSGLNLNEFVEEWLKNKTFLYTRCLQNLTKNEVEIKSFLKFIDKTKQLSNKRLNKIFHQLKSNKIKEELLLNTSTSFLTTQDYKSLLKNENLKIRQATALKVSENPLNFETVLEDLLEDKSYKTIEVSLFALWKNFPNNRSRFLNKTKHVVGFNNKNIRILWLALALITDGYEDVNKPRYLNELTGYTNKIYGFDVQQNAFQYLHQIKACLTACKENLNEATKHHHWQFSKFAKQMLKLYK